MNTTQWLKDWTTAAQWMRTGLLGLGAALSLGAEPVQRPGAHGGPGDGSGADSGREVRIIEPTEGERIGWFTSLADARTEAERSGRPIFLLSAQPSCSTVPGAW